MVMSRLFILIFTLFFTTAAYGAAEKVSVRYAKGFSVEYQNELTLITVKNPWPGAKSGFKYLLKPRGSKTPPGFSDCQVVEVPVTRIIALSTTLLAFLEQLDLLDQLVGFSDLSRVHSGRVKIAEKNNPILEVGQGSNLQVETVLDLDPGIIFTYGTGNFRDVHPKLLEAGLHVAIVGEYMESHPLGRSEWIKFLALFCGLGPESEQLFSDLEARYSHLATLTQTVQHRPTVITGVPFSGRWFVAGGNSFISQFVHDAGGDYVWSKTRHSGALPMDIELVYERGINTDFWLNTGIWSTIDQARKADPRFIEFSALKNGRLFNNNRRVNPEGGNDYWESGMMAPDFVLADLIHILHPQLLPDHQLFYYTHLR